jgi:hypothetical protein
MAEARSGQSNTDTIRHQENPYMHGSNGLLSEPSEMSWEDEQRGQAEKLKNERLRSELHRKVNPVEAKDVFNARKEQVKKEIEQIRHELKLLAQEIMAFHQEIEVSLMSPVSDPGEDGVYYLTFFQKLREFIMLLRQQVHSARTWTSAFNSKKRKQRKGAGIEISGKSHEQTAGVYDHMHHERSTAYSGS